jgi:hypothetical protein
MNAFAFLGRDDVTACSLRTLCVKDRHASAMTVDRSGAFQRHGPASEAVSGTEAAGATVISGEHHRVRGSRQIVFQTRLSPIPNSGGWRAWWLTS